MESDRAYYLSTELSVLELQIPQNVKYEELAIAGVIQQNC